MEQWQTICKQSDLVKNTGVCALIDKEQVAVFYCGRSQSVYALSNFDPIGEANVISRGGLSVVLTVRWLWRLRCISSILV